MGGAAVVVVGAIVGIVGKPGATHPAILRFNPRISSPASHGAPSVCGAGVANDDGREYRPCMLGWQGGAAGDAD